MRLVCSVVSELSAVEPNALFADLITQFFNLVMIFFSVNLFFTPHNFLTNLTVFIRFAFFILNTNRLITTFCHCATLRKLSLNKSFCRICKLMLIRILRHIVSLILSLTQKNMKTYRYLQMPSLNLRALACRFRKVGCGIN